MQSYNVSLSDVSKALSAANVLVAVGRIEDHDKLYLIVSDTRLANAEQIAATTLRSGANGVVRLDDIATVEVSTEPQWIRVTADGHDAVLFQVYQQPGANTVQIAEGIKKKLQDEEKRLPKGIAIKGWA